MAKRIVLAYSGGLDTSVAVRWMTEELGAEVIALAVDLGQGGTGTPSGRVPSLPGPSRSSVVDARQEFGSDFVAPAIRANGLYEGRYPLISSLSRPVIVKHLVRAARRARRGRHRSRVHREGERPGPFRGFEPCSRAGSGSGGAGSHVGIYPRRLDRVRQAMGYPDQRYQGEPVLGRPKPLGPYSRMRCHRGPLGYAAS